MDFSLLTSADFFKECIKWKKEYLHNRILQVLIVINIFPKSSKRYKLIIISKIIFENFPWPVFKAFSEQYFKYSSQYHEKNINRKPVKCSDVFPNHPPKK